MDTPDPLANLPDPSKRYQVFALLRDNVIFVEVVDAETKTGFILSPVEAMHIAADINTELARMIQEATDRIDGWLDPEEVDPGDQRWHKEIWKRGQG